MATASSTALSPSLSIVSTRKRKTGSNVHYIRGLNSFDGLMAQNRVTSLGRPVSTESCFARVVSSIWSQGRGRGGYECSAVGEIFRIAATMNGLTLVGVAVGFVLLRIEAFVEEAEEA